jgi:hypothetical protein
VVAFCREGSVVYYRFAGGFPVRLVDDCVLALARLALRHGEDGPP